MLLFGLIGFLLMLLLIIITHADDNWVWLLCFIGFVSIMLIVSDFSISKESKYVLTKTELSDHINTIYFGKPCKIHYYEKDCNGFIISKIMYSYINIQEYKEK